MARSTGPKRLTTSVLAATLGATLVLSGAPPASAVSSSLSNTDLITIPDGGNASPYPSPITVSGMAGTIVDIQVTLTGLTHAFPQDLGVVLVAPNGDALLLMDAVSTETPAGSMDLTISDGAAAFMPQAGPLTTGTYKPTTFIDGDFFPAPGPLVAYQAPGPLDGNAATLMSTFGGDDANGVWNLFVRDFVAGDAGSIAGGWGLRITTAPPEPALTAISPASPGLSTQPVVTGTAEAGSTVKLYGDATCSGPPLATGTAEAFGSTGLEVTVAAGSTTTFRATASDSLGDASFCSASSISYTQQDLDTTLTQTPKKKVKTTKRKAKVSFSFSSATGGATFECSVDGKPYAPCPSGRTFKLKAGLHTFAVRAVASGQTDPTPATYTFKIKRKR